MTDTLLAVLRIAVLAAAILAALVALVLQGIRSGKLSPFHPLARLARQATPILRPLERRLAAGGGDPRTAPWWLLGLVIVGGLILLSAVQWVVAAARGVEYAASAGWVGVVALLVDVAYNVVILALIVRVVGSWFGVGRWTRWMRPAYTLTDWIVAPLARLIPPLGAIDLSPLAAWVALLVIRQVVFALLRRF